MRIGGLKEGEGSGNRSTGAGDESGIWRVKGIESVGGVYTVQAVEGATMALAVEVSNWL